MAVMFPPDVQTFQTEGEARFYHKHEYMQRGWRGHVRHAGRRPLTRPWLCHTVI